MQKIHQHLLLLILLYNLAFISGSMATEISSIPATKNNGQDASFEQLITDDYLYLLTQHLYRWYMDEADILNNSGKNDFSFWITPLPQKLDPEDHSQVARIILPDFNISVLVKKSDYTINELDISVSNKTYRIVQVSRISSNTQKPDHAINATVSFPAMKQYLFSIRNQVKFPSEDLLKHLAKAVREKLHEDARKNNDSLPGGEQLVYLSPLSPLANELWIFWESGRLLLHFSSDLDLTDPDLQAINQLAIETYDVDEQVVVSLDEVPGSNAYLTRDQVGRALYNCIILGKRLIIPPQNP